MRILLIFVTLFAVTGVVYAETKAKCGDRAYLVFNECFRFAEEVKGVTEGDLDLLRLAGFSADYGSFVR
ncbi:hypothetical protein F4Z99_00200 [Candidatus Poribacteria bacterium]|nr:hypothetical protein [Candidatus Poribacteria bacterium]MYC39899.1 hypothetical protein [Candidatus Dadabacteria bacterium]